MLVTLIEVVHIVVALFMILVVLVQGGNQGGVGAAFGGGNSSGIFGATGATSLLGKLTYGAAAVFMLTSISLTVLQGKGGNIGLKERLKQAGETQPAGETGTENKAGETTPAATSGNEAPKPAESGK
jgi:preprotein translocase subunit SecG